MNPILFVMLAFPEQTITSTPDCQIIDFQHFAKSFDLEKGVCRGQKYTSYHPRTLRIGLEIAKNNRDLLDTLILRDEIHLAVAGTFSSAPDSIGNTEGAIVYNGLVFQGGIEKCPRDANGDLTVTKTAPPACKNWDGAAIFPPDGGVRIIRTHKGEDLTRKYLETIVKSESALIQAFLLMYGGRYQPIGLKKPAFLRALVTKRDGTAFIVESDDPLMPEQFANLLEALEVINAIYLDVGDYRGMIFRTNGEVNIRRPNNAKELTNAIVFFR